MVGPGLPHDRPPLSKRALVSGRVPLLADADRLTEKGVRHVDGRVVDCDFATHRLVIDDGSEIEADQIVWATGLAYPRPPVAGIALAAENTTGATMLDLTARTAVEGRDVVVIGAGLIGSETAATLAGRHRVTLVDMLDRPLARLHPTASAAAARTLADLGVTFLAEARIEEITASSVRTSTHGTLPCDVAVSAAGFRTSLPTALAPDGRSLTVDVDERLRVVGTTDVFACGDCIAFPHPRHGRLQIPHWDHALYSGRHAADSLLGDDTPYVREPYYFSDIGPLRIQQVGLATAAAEWRVEDGLTIGRDDVGRIVAVLFLNAPARLREARELVAAGANP